MKSFRLISFLTTILLAFSCNKMPDTPLFSPYPIEFQPTVQTKSYITQTSDPLFQAGLSVFAKKTNTSNESAEIMTNKKVYFDNSAQRWTYGSPLVNWGVNCNHHFLAVFPYTENYSFTGDTYTVNNVLTVKTSGLNPTSGIPDGQDLMYGRAQQHYMIGDSPTPVLFNMEHALAAISFNIRNASPYDITSVTDIKLSGLTTKAESVSYVRDSDAKPTIILSTESLVYDLKNHTGTEQAPYISTGNTDYIPMEETFMILPQKFSSKTVTLHLKVKFAGIALPVEKNLILSNVKLNNDNNASLNFSYVSGKRYIYKIDITNNDITCEVKVVPWIEEPIIELK